MDFLKLKQLRGSDIWKHQVKSLKTPTLRVHGFIIGRILQSDIFRRGEVGWLHSEFYVISQKRKEQLSEVHFFYVSLKQTRFCRLEDERLLDKLEIGSFPSVMKTLS